MAQMPTYDVQLGSNISRDAKAALDHWIAELKANGIKGSQGAIVDVLIKTAIADAELKEHVAAQLPPIYTRRK